MTRGMMKILGSQEWYVIFSTCVCHVYFCVSVIELHITREHPNYWELQKIITFCQIPQCGSRKGVVVICQTCEAICGELKCVGFCALSICGVVL
jgi:hypothetical protein